MTKPNIDQMPNYLGILVLKGAKYAIFATLKTFITST